MQTLFFNSMEINMKTKVKSNSKSHKHIFEVKINDRDMYYRKLVLKNIPQNTLFVTQLCMCLSPDMKGLSNFISQS